MVIPYSDVTQQENRNLEVDTPVELAVMYAMILDVPVTLYSLILQKAFK